MADDDDDDSQKTEDPTQRRLEEAFKKGQTPNSREVNNFLLILILTFTISWLFPAIFTKTTYNLAGFLENAHDVEIYQGNLGKIIIRAFAKNFLLILPAMIAIIISAILSSFMQNKGRFMINEDPIKFDLSRISPMKGLKRLFSKNSLIEFLKALVKIVIVSITCFLSVKSELNKLNSVYDKSMLSIMTLLMVICINMLIAICVVMAIIATLDYLYQQYDFIQSMKMTKHELKEEYKQTEGSPEIKARIRKIRNERARKRIMAAVPTADVVITNPTHFSVALKYDEFSMQAPVVVAKGQGNIALKIREIANEHKVPIVENPPLARILFKEIDIDQEITLEHYKAVAEIISYVYNLKNNVNRRA